MSKICPSCGTACDDTQFFCPRCGAGLPVQQTYPQAGPAIGMKWFKFIIYFQLFAAALFNLINSFSAMTGSHYGGSEEAAMVYAFFPSLKTVDMVYGILLIALAAGDIFVRMRLAGYRTGAPKLYLIVLGAAVAADLFYLVSVYTILSDWAGLMDFSSIVAQYIGQVIGAGVMIAINFIYFKKREHLFVN